MMQLTSEDLERCRRAVEGFVARRLGNRDAAPDLTQDILVLAWRKRENWRGEHLLAWVIGIARHECSGYLRQAFRRRHLAPMLPLECCNEELEEAAVEKDRKTMLTTNTLRLLDRLHPAQRQAVQQRLIYGWSYDEMAAAAGVKPLTLKNRVARGVKKLREFASERAP